MTAYYNEIDPYAAQWLRNLISAGHIAPGDVHERSIVDVRADELRGYTQCHFFAGIGGWSLALRLAGWSDDRSVWTGSCPCQPFSVAGEGKAADDERHLWPAWFPLIAECRPAIVFGEQVDAAIGWGWLDAVFADLEGEGYACGTAVLPACGIGAPHIRQRCWFVADTSGGPIQIPQRAPEGRARNRRASGLADATGERQRPGIARGDRSGGKFMARTEPGRDGCDHGEARVMADTGHEYAGRPAGRRQATGWRSFGDATGRRPWVDCDWLPCTDGKSRPVEPGTFPLAHGIPGRVGRLRAYGNAIVPQTAAEFIKAADSPHR